MRIWIEGARPRTLPAAVVPVLVGTGVAASEGSVRPGHLVLALAVSLSIQVATNFANDYSDGVRGTDAERVGPVRLVGSGLASPARVKAAAMAAFGVAAITGLWLAALTSWWLVLVGAACLAAGWFYTGGPRPYGYVGLGELFVFVFFGLVATVGTSYVQTGRLSALAWFAAVPVGLLATALLVANNLRDIPTDSQTGKLTLAVRLGDARTRVMYELVVYAAVGWSGLMAAAFLRPVLVVPMAVIPWGARLAGLVRGGASGLDLIEVLSGTGRLQLVFGVLLSLALVVS
ncbi:MAG: 1,4-dihydroxy-2-naphthoate polyprenyltransferase [Acidimicrobiales bacterium]